jgi:hypothetical protein
VNSGTYTFTSPGIAVEVEVPPETEVIDSESLGSSATSEATTVESAEPVEPAVTIDSTSTAEDDPGETSGWTNYAPIFTDPEEHAEPGDDYRLADDLKVFRTTRQSTDGPSDPAMPAFPEYPHETLLTDQSRLLLDGHVQLFGVPSGDGGVCMVAFVAPNNDSGSVTMHCLTALGEDRLAFAVGLPAERPPLLWGITADDVAQILVEANGQSVPVTLGRNGFAAELPPSAQPGAVKLIVTYDDGTTREIPLG